MKANAKWCDFSFSMEPAGFLARARHPELPPQGASHELSVGQTSKLAIVFFDNYICKNKGKAKVFPVK